MFRNVLFIFTTYLIINYTSGISVIDPETKEAVTSSIRLIGQLYRSEVEIKNITTKERKIVVSVYGSLAQNIDHIIDHLEDFATTHTKIIDFNSRLRKYNQAANKIENRYYKFLGLIDPENKFENRSKEDFAVGVLKNNGIDAIVKDLHHSLIGDEYGSPIQFLSSNYENWYPACGTFKTKQRFFYNLLHSIFINEYKSYVVMLYSHQIYRDHLNYTDFNVRLSDLNRASEKRIHETVKVFGPIIGNSTRLMRQCNLQKNYAHDKTYTSLQNLFTRIFQYSSDIKKKPNHHCPGKCPTDGDILGTQCDGKCKIKQRQCNNLVHCEHASEHDLCLEENQNKIRRYSIVKNYYSVWHAIWIFFNSDCPNEQLISNEKVCSKSSVCNCICDESKQSDRYFSLDDVQSDVFSNYVVTGVKFVKKDGIVRLQIQEGELLPFGFINQKTVRWTSTENVKYLNGDIQLVSLDRLYHNITWTGNRGIFLNNVELSNKHVVTGVRFSKDHIEDENFLKIEIRSTRFDIVTGKLDTKTSKWKSNQAADFKDNLIKLDKYDVPTNVDLLRELDSVENKITRFTPTNVLSKDTGSSVVPYLDIQPVYSDTAVPLSGVGLDLMGAANSGGYLVLTSKSLDVLPMLSLF